MSVQYVAEMNIDLGEKIHIRSIVKPKCEQDIPFAIRDARFELIDGSGLMEDSGECSITGHEIDALIAPQKPGSYRLKYIYDIADEIWVDNIRLRVG